MDRSDARPTWTFLTHHARVLILIARDPGIRLRDVALACGITERTVQGIVAELEAAGYLTRTRQGRRNHYEVVAGTHFRHPAEAGQQIEGLLALVNGGTRLERAPAAEITDGADGAEVTGAADAGGRAGPAPVRAEASQLREPGRSRAT